MPNYCDYSMCVIGRKENVEEFIKVIKADYNYVTMEFSYDRHLFRVFEADYDEIEQIEGDVYQVIINGDCAWSVSSCMLDSYHSYYSQCKEKYPKEFRGTTLQIESERLNLDIKVFSEERGRYFQEHYIIRKGELEVDECVDWEEYFLEEYKTKEEAEKDLGIEITDEEWENEEVISRGGFEWDFEI